MPHRYASRLASLHLIARSIYTGYYIFLNVNFVTSCARSIIWGVAAYSSWRLLYVAGDKFYSTSP